MSLEDLLTQQDLAYDPPDRETLETVFNRAWAGELVRRVPKRLEEECRTTGKQKHYEIFRLRILEPTLEGADPPPTAALAEELGLAEKEA